MKTQEYGETAVGLCENPDHRDCPLTHVCLDQECNEVRAACYHCLIESHMGHNSFTPLINNLDPDHGQIDRTAKLSCNASVNMAQDYFREIRGHQDNIKNKLKGSLQKIKRKVIEAFHYFELQFDAIIGSFQQSTRNRAIQLFKQSSSNESTNYVRMIEFLQKVDIQNITFLRNFARYQESQYLMIFEKSFGEANTVLDKMTDELKKVDILNITAQEKELLTRETIIFENDSLNKIKTVLRKMIKWNSPIIQLQIRDNTQQCSVDDEIIDYMGNLKLKKLYINPCYTLEKKSVLRLIEQFSDLKQLSLINCKEFDEQCAESVMHKSPNIEKLNYEADWNNSLRQMTEMEQFWHVKPHFNSLAIKLPIEVAEKMGEKWELLQNVVIQKCHNKATAEIITNLKHLKTIHLGQRSMGGGKLNLNRKTIEALQQHTQLQCIVLNKIHNCQKLATVFERNTKLQTIVFNGYCYGVNDNLISTIANRCKQLRQLYFHCNNQMKGNAIWKITSLESLSLIYCRNIDSQAAVNGIVYLNKLQFLDLSTHDNYSFWVNDKLMGSVSTLTELKYLKINNTDVTSKGLSKLTTLKQLQTLIIVKNQVSGEAIIKLCRQLPNLTKLALKLMSKSTDGDMETLVSDKQLSSRLTHLSIQGCKQLTGKHISQFINLKVINIYGTENVDKAHKQNWRSKGINMIN